MWYIFSDILSPIWFSSESASAPSKRLPSVFNGLDSPFTSTVLTPLLYSTTSSLYLFMYFSNGPPSASNSAYMPAKSTSL